MPNQIQRNAWEQYKIDNGNDWKLRWNNKTGTPASLYGGKSKSYEGDPDTKAKLFLKDNMELFGFEDENYIDQLIVKKTVTKENGTFVRLQQIYSSFPVIGGEYIIRFDNDSKVTFAGGYLYNKFNLSLSPILSESGAIEAAKNNMNINDLKSEPYGKLVIFPWEGDYYLSWRVILDEDIFKKWESFVDAQNGEFLFYDNLVSFASDSGNAYLTHPGNGNYSTVSIIVDKVFLVYTLKNYTVRPLTSSGQTISNSTGHFYYYPPPDTVYDSTNFDMVNVLYHIYNFARNYMEITLGFTIPGAIDATVHYSLDAAAFTPDDFGNWGFLVFGQKLTGDYYDHAKSNEEIYHEYTHAVLYNRIGLKGNFGEHSAMNEGFADYFASSYAGDPNWAEWLVKEHPSDFRILNTDPGEFNYANYNIVTYLETGHGAGETHTNGMIWSGALWDLRSSLTPQLADELIYGGIGYLTSTPTFLDGLNGIIAYDNFKYGGNNIETIKSVFCNRGITFPETPANLTLSGNPGDFVTLGWSANTECNLAGYKIYRDYDFNGYQLLVTVSSNSTSYVDRSITIGSSPLDPTVRYIITAIDDLSQESASSNTVSTKAGGINKENFDPNVENQQIETYDLYNTYPNPFNPETKIEFSIPEKSKVLLKVYNLLGEEVTTLVDEILAQGIHSKTFYAAELPSGIYIVRLVAENRKANIFITKS